MGVLGRAVDQIFKLSISDSSNDVKVYSYEDDFMHIWDPIEKNTFSVLDSKAKLIVILNHNRINREYSRWFHTIVGIRNAT